MPRVTSWPRRSIARARIAIVRLVRRAVHAFRASLRLRIMASALAIGVVAVAVLGLYLSTSVRDGMVERRLESIMNESAALTADANQEFRSSAVADEQQALLLMSSVAERILASASSVEAVFVVHPLDTQPQVSDVIIPDSMGAQQNTLLTADLRRENAALRERDGATGEQVMQFTEVRDPGQSNRAEPGVVVGTSLQVPRFGPYEIYYVYSLQAEQETLTFVHRVLGIGAAFVLLLIGLITALVSRQTVAPVTRAAAVAERLADGRLDERLPDVTGIDEMATLSRSFNAMADSLQQQIQQMEELSAAQRRFVSDVSHELRTPLTTIRMAGDVIHAARDQLSADVSRSAELLTDQIERFEGLLSDLLEISRFDAGAAVLDAERRDLGDVVMSVVQMARPLAENKNVPLSVRLPDGDTVADIDPRRIERIVRNLVVNAIEHSEGRPVEVTVGQDAGAVAVVVRDFGVGMTKPEVEHVFDRFWRADPARARTTGGSGLGLAIAQEDARLHAGRLEVWARPGRGASFRLTLPRRAGIRLDSSPIPLVPDSHEPQVTTDQIPVVHPPTGPSPTTIPDLEIR
ncbi:MtrAB system histidine kinase MtrB [Myceligenerans pegani]|uniref:Sensor histidine kinase MtrB n=1 Tax=Myceligenerans pegani TaxID=2776917 RepID=A0ABR9MY92_9MICO|nr:MtrAB system histidine kinase MtrB [Myceligenerans sp. TRM 65318]MBE1876346.1 HAMP domain-containing histidine kinase [Myceligenerans sp. TRM 65318]MBE3018617.1 HAMP domain-containing histidine kinase [Myceligenerans sp. TRM 65318]